MPRSLLISATLLATLACVPPAEPLPGATGGAGGCGSFCPVLCGGQPCPSSCASCSPEDAGIFTDSDSPSGLVLVGDDAYVCGDTLQPALFRVSLLDGRVSTAGGMDGSCPDVVHDAAQNRLLWFINQARFGEQPLGLWSQPLGDSKAKLEVTIKIPVAIAARQGEALWSGLDGVDKGLFVVRGGASVPVPGMVGPTLPGTIAVGPDGRIFVAWPEVRNISTSLDADGTGARLLVDGKRTNRDPLEPLAMAASAEHLYYGMDGALWRVAVDGASPAERLVEGQERVVGLVVEGDEVAWLEVKNGSLLRLSLSSRRVELLASGLLQPRNLAAQQGVYHWLEPPRRALRRLRRGP